MLQYAVYKNFYTILHGLPCSATNFMAKNSNLQDREKQNCSDDFKILGIMPKIANHISCFMLFSHAGRVQTRAFKLIMRTACFLISVLRMLKIVFNFVLKRVCTLIAVHWLCDGFLIKTTFLKLCPWHVYSGMQC